ncbi:MAG: PBP1A family penicillin-binding protein [Rhodospirillales bacterium]|nr:PBP1A family penicillin-binding protein [Rhodospirillales bacterium]
MKKAIVPDPRHRIRTSTAGIGGQRRARPGSGSWSLARFRLPPLIGGGGGAGGRSGGAGPGSGRRWLRTLVKWTAVVGIWAGIFVAGILAWYAADLPDIDQALAPTRRPAITVLAADGSELATVGDFFGDALTIGEMPPALPLAVMAAEDRRFYDHFGVDVIGMVRAMFVNLQAGSVRQGGSTISQQAAKNLFLSHERTMKRKVQELLLALWLEHRFSKDQILAIYLNRVYFGAGAYGVDAAARKYFGQPARHVTLYQAAMLAGLLKAPSRLNPIANPALAAERAKLVLAAMVDAGYLSREDLQFALQQGAGTLASRRQVIAGRHFVDWIAAELPSFVKNRDRDLVVRTTLDPRLQRIAEARVAEMLASAPARKAAAGEAAVVILDGDGAIRAMVGGGDYDDSPFNRAARAFRQPGSAFKPIVYAAGLEAGLTPDSRMIDSPLQVAGWRPQNFSQRYEGEVSLRYALAQSINTVAVSVSEYAGRRRVVDVARRLGITADLTATPSLALGSSEVSLLELTGAYAAFAGGGVGVWPYGIVEVTDRQGRPAYRRSGGGPGRAVSRQVAAQVTDMLVAVVESGTGRAARFGRPIAGKTGTSQNFRDAWFLGYTRDLICGVWMGNDDDTPMKKVTGGTLPAQLWRQVMADAHAGRVPLPLQDEPALPPPATTMPADAAVSDGRTDDGPAAAEPDLWDRLLRVFGG